MELEQDGEMIVEYEPSTKSPPGTPCRQTLRSKDEQEHNRQPQAAFERMNTMTNGTSHVGHIQNIYMLSFA